MSLSHRASKRAFDPKKNVRAYPRASVRAKGALFFPDRELEETCLVGDLSADGAGLKTTCCAAKGARVVLYVEGFGRFEGKISRRDRLRVGVKFKCTEARRDRIAEMIAAYRESGSLSSTTLRQKTRLSDIATLHSFTGPSGEKQKCEIIDMALSGASLRTDERPNVGETILFGKTTALVVRHTNCGIAVTFPGANAPKTISGEDMTPV